MAHETEGKSLDKSRVTESIQRLINLPTYGHYLFIIDNFKKLFCGMNMVTYEYDFNNDKTVMWLQSVFISENYRMKGLFRKLLAANENFVKGKANFKQSIKLYMEKNNYKAEQVYFKLGFKTTNEVLYELDYDFDDIKSLKSDSFKYLNLNENNFGYVIKCADSEFFETLNSFSNLQMTSLVNSEKLVFSLKEKLAAIKKVIDDDNLGKVIYIFDNSKNKLVGLFLIFYEFSDWRNSLFWWVNDFLINQEYSEFFNMNIKSVIYSLTKLNYDMKSCGLRFLTTNEHENLLKETVLLKSHYIIYEKKIE